jgi:TetR/AcrR family transcriptional regulator, fatty acid metabolism regulator protein
MNSSEVAKDRKGKIVKATAECISQYGYSDFSLQKVADKAGVTKGIIHYYYLNKNDLMTSVLDFIFIDIVHKLTCSLKKVQDPSEKLKIFIIHFLDILYQRREFYQISAHFLLDLVEPQNKSKFDKHLEFFHKICEEILSEGIAHKKFYQVDTSEYASFVVSILSGINFHKLCYSQNKEHSIDNLVVSAVFSGLQSLKED